MSEEKRGTNKAQVPELDLIEESGWDRVKALFEKTPGEDVASEWRDWSVTVFVSSVVGFLFGGMIGARHAGDKFIARSHSSKFTSTMQAQRELHSAVLKGFVGKGSHWGWRVGLFAGLFSGSTHLISEYRGKEDPLNYIMAGAVTGGLFRLPRGVKPFIGGAVLGTLICVPVGLCVNGLDLVLVGSEERKRMRQNKAAARQRAREKWKERLNATSTLIEDMGEVDTGLQSYYKLAAGSEATETGSQTSTNKETEQKTT